MADMIYGFVPEKTIGVREREKRTINTRWHCTVVRALASLLAVLFVCEATPSIVGVIAT
jgi:hypothetical protein